MRTAKKFFVFFNASVILAGTASPKGGSGELLKFVKKKKIKGLISEIVLNEVLKHAEKIGFEKKGLERQVLAIFEFLAPAPNPDLVESYYQFIIDRGDAHLLASSEELKVEFLATLDKKHLLSIKNKIKWVKIVSPADLIEIIQAPIHK